FKNLGIGLAAGCLICSTAFAQEETGTVSETAQKGSIRQMFKNFDTDGDGKLSDAEKEAAMAKAKERLKEQLEKNSDLKTRLLEKFDADKNGVLSDDELSAAVKSRKAGRGKGEMMGPGGEGRGGREEMMKKFDADGDGKLSDAEKEAAKAEFITRMKADIEKNSDMKARLLEKFDADKDGVLSDSELSTAAAQGPGNRGGEGMGGREEMMKKFDADGDGKLSDTEKETAKAAFTARMKEDMEKNPEMKAKLLEKFDADKDGALSDAEIKTIESQGPPRGEGMGGGKRGGGKGHGGQRGKR
ncbi:MAG TPA: EF-hand domain-containing protein, partial [Candidatus Wallbacteria bacterium]|nr:EF-hand domain-containing protein [Candidatus Wallbacteria bacterium]